MTDFEKLQMVFNDTVEAIGEDEAYNLCYKMLNLSILKFLMGAAKVSLQEFGETYYPDKQTPLFHADEYVKNISYAQLSTTAIDFKYNTQKDFSALYPKPSVMTTHVPYDTVADFYGAYICINIGSKMLDVLAYLAKTPFTKSSYKWLCKRVEIPLFPEFDQYTIKQLKEQNLVSPFTMAAWEVYPKEFLPTHEEIKAHDLSWQVIEMVMWNSNTTIAILKKRCLDIYRNQNDYYTKDGVKNLYDTLFSQIERQ